MPSAAASRSASSHTMTGALPPSSRCTRFRSVAAAAATSMPARTLPVIDTRPGTGCSTSARPLSRSPHTTLNTPAGRNSAASSASITVVSGVALRRLQHDRVAGRERGRDLPDRHHQRVVPRRDLRDHADRLAPHVRREPGHVLAPRRGPSSMRAAPAKKRIWSTAGGISSAAISALGLPVLRHSASMKRSASFSSASAMRNSARLRSDGVGRAPAVERGVGGGDRVVDVGRARTGAPSRRSHRCTGRRAASWRRPERPPACRSPRSARLPSDPSLHDRLTAEASIRRSDRYICK